MHGTNNKSFHNQYYINGNVMDGSSEVYDSVSYNGKTYSKDGKKVFGTVITDLDAVGDVYVYTFAQTADGEVYSTYTTLKGVS